MSLSVLVPSIRPYNLYKLYESIKSSWSKEFEMIVISPNALPDQLIGVKNVKLILSYGSPIRCQQEALTHAICDYVTWAADDGVFLPESLDIAFNKIKKETDVVMGKYYEGNNDGSISMQDDSYYNLKNHDGSRLKELPKDIYWMLNVGLVSRKLLNEVGGWDCMFEVCPCSYNDLAIRLQNYGCNFIIQDELMFTCSHLPGHEGDHAPIHDAQTLHDHKLFEKIWNQPNPENRIKIDINNWQQSPERWVRRFG